MTNMAAIYKIYCQPDHRTKSSDHTNNNKPFHNKVFKNVRRINSRQTFFLFLPSSVIARQRSCRGNLGVENVVSVSFLDCRVVAALLLDDGKKTLLFPFIHKGRVRDE